MTATSAALPTQRSLAFPLFAALLLGLLAALLLVRAAGAAPIEQVDTDDAGVVLDEPTATAEPIVVLDPHDVTGDLAEEVAPPNEPTPVAIPSVSPDPGPNPNDVVGDLPEEVAQSDGPSDLYFDTQSCNPPAADLIDDVFCAPDPGFVGQVYSGTVGTYAQHYVGPLPVELLDTPAGAYMISAKADPLEKLIFVCRIEDQAGNLIDTLSNHGALALQIGHDLVYRCTAYQLPDSPTVTDVAPPANGPVTVELRNLLCPAGTDPALNYYGLIGRCHQPFGSRYYAMRTAAGDVEEDKTRSDGSASFALYGDVWTLSTELSGEHHPPVIYCNVKDFLGQEPAHYAPFMTYPYGANGAVLALEPELTWLCVAYNIPLDPGTGSDTADVSVSSYACPEGTSSPSLAACLTPLAGATVHLLYGTETIVATRQTDAHGAVGWLAPANLQAFGLAAEAPAGYRNADTALCARNGGASATYPVDEHGIIDLGALTATDEVACFWFSIPDANAQAADQPIAESDETLPQDDGSSIILPLDAATTAEVAQPDAGASADSDGGYEYALLPLETDE